MLTCGAAKRDINPDLPVNLAGYRSDLVATDVHDNLHVAALYLACEDERAALLTFDTIGLPAEFVSELQQACANAVGISPRSVLTTASHTHSGPRIGRRVDGSSLAIRTQPIGSASSTGP